MTDKHEGHTEGPCKPTILTNMMWTVGNLSVEWQEADKLLIADATLLLEEVKRLREGIEQALVLLNTSAIAAKQRLEEMIE